jgi:predicted transposase YbfD/YdcC
MQDALMRVPQDDEITLPIALVKTIQHFVPGFFAALVDLPEPRNPLKLAYPVEEEIFVGILAQMLLVGSRRNIKYKLHTPACIENVLTIGKRAFPPSKSLFGWPEETLPHGDTLEYLLCRMGWLSLHDLRLLLMRSLLRGRCLESFRLHGRYKIAIDGTGCLVYKTQHCDHCLVKKASSGETIYYHPVLEAKLVTDNGMAFSIETVFIENEKVDVDKQDCELKAFDRLAAQLKRDFPQLPICLLLDGLFAGEPVFKICEDNGWSYLIVFKEGKMPVVFAEYEALKKMGAKQEFVFRPAMTCRQVYRWVNDIDYGGRKLNAFECVEEKSEEDAETELHRFVFLSSFWVDDKNVMRLARGGRSRWTIENEGFNTQKNGGYELEHAFSEDNAAAKCWYLLTQIAHNFNQLLAKGSLLRERIQRDMGGLKVFLQRMWAVFTEVRIDSGQLAQLLARRIQIRFESG